MNNNIIKDGIINIESYINNDSFDLKNFMQDINTIPNIVDEIFLTGDVGKLLNNSYLTTLQINNIIKKLNEIEKRRVVLFCNLKNYDEEKFRKINQNVFLTLNYEITNDKITDRTCLDKIKYINENSVYIYKICIDVTIGDDEIIKYIYEIFEKSIISNLEMHIIRKDLAYTKTRQKKIMKLFENYIPEIYSEYKNVNFYPYIFKENEGRIIYINNKINISTSLKTGDKIFKINEENIVNNEQMTCKLKKEKDVNLFFKREKQILKEYSLNEDNKLIDNIVLCETLPYQLILDLFDEINKHTTNTLLLFPDFYYDDLLFCFSKKCLSKENFYHYPVKTLHTNINEKKYTTFSVSDCIHAYNKFKKEVPDSKISVIIIPKALLFDKQYDYLGNNINELEKISLARVVLI